MKELNEHKTAVKLANTILDEPGRDPDDDLSVLARQLLRTHEALETAIKKLLDLSEGRSCILPDNRAHAEAMLTVAEAFLNPHLKDKQPGPY